MKILVTGGTGLVGTSLVAKLLKEGHTVRLFSRSARTESRVFQGDIEAVDGSIANWEDVGHIAEGCEVVFHNAGIVGEKGEESTFEAVNVGGTRNMLHEAERAGVRRFVYISSLGADRGASAYHESKRRAEALVKDYSHEWVITRPSVVYGPGDEVVSLLLKMVRTLPVIPVIAGGDQLSQPVWATDLAEALADCVSREDIVHQILLVAGAEKISMNQMLDKLSNLTGRTPAKINLPGWLAQQGTTLMSAVGVDVPFSPDQVTMLTEGNMIYDGETNALTDIFNVRPLPLDQRLQELIGSVPVQSPTEGVGSLRRHSFERVIKGSPYGARQLFAMVIQDLGELFKDTAVDQNPESDEPVSICEGATMTLAIPIRGNCQVRVADLAETSCMLLTVEGHPLAGAVRFAAEDVPGGVRFQIETFDRAANPLDAMAMKTVGRPAQSRTWNQVLEAITELAEGHSGSTDEKTYKLSEEQAKPVEAWLDEVILRSRQASLG